MKSVKKKSQGSKLQDKSGIILFVVLWALVILTTIAIGLGKSTSIDIALAKNAVSKKRASFIAYGGLLYAKSQLQMDSQDASSAAEDNLYYCGIPIFDQWSSRSLFSGKKLSNGFFDVFYPIKKEDNENEYFYGFEDEDRKININALTRQSLNVFKELIVLQGFDEDVAGTIAFSVVDWKDKNNSLSDQTDGAEEEFYESMGYHCKNAPFDSKEELLLVRGMTKEIYQAIKKHITIFPKKGPLVLTVNFNTASSIVLKAIAFASSGSRNNTSLSDAESLVERIIQYRSGEDLQEGTSDDRSLDVRAMSLNNSEKVVLSSMARYWRKSSRFFHAHIQGHDQLYDAHSQVDAIIDRNDLSIVFYKAN